MGIFDEPATCVVLKPFVPGEDFLSQLNKPIMPPSCADVPWRFLGLSMAAWNALCVVTLSVISLFATFIRKKSS